jgi:hypothetical protein
MSEVVIETMQAIAGQQDWPYLRAVGRARASGRDTREVAGEFAMGSIVGNDREWSIYRRAAKVLADLLDQVETSSTTQQRIRSGAAACSRPNPHRKPSDRGGAWCRACAVWRR